MNITMMISGSRSIDKLPPIIFAALNRFISDEINIIVGDAPGVDRAIQHYLAWRKYPNVTVYVAGNKIRNNLGNWSVVYVQGNYIKRDAAMCNKASHGLAIWDQVSKGTERNIFHISVANKPIQVFDANGQEIATF